MNTKQTPGQAAVEALQIYADGQESSQGFGENYTAARQSIIKAFQDRARLLEVLEAILSWDKNNLYSSVIDKAHDAVEIAKAKL